MKRLTVCVHGNSIPFDQHPVAFCFDVHPFNTRVKSFRSGALFCYIKLRSLPFKPVDLCKCTLTLWSLSFFNTGVVVHYVLQYRDVSTLVVSLHKCRSSNVSHLFRAGGYRIAKPKNDNKSNTLMLCLPPNQTSSLLPLPEDGEPKAASSLF